MNYDTVENALKGHIKSRPLTRLELIFAVDKSRDAVRREINQLLLRKQIIRIEFNLGAYKIVLYKWGG